MHRALAIVEVVENIVGYVDWYSLAPVGRTSRQFFAPAMSVLWSEHCLGTIGRLLDIALGSENEDISHIMPMADRWRRFDLYASFVRSLTVSNTFLYENALALDELEHEDYLQSEARDKLASLAFMRPSWPLLPNLRSLTLAVTAPQHLTLAMPYVNSALEELHIEGHIGWAKRPRLEGQWTIAATILLNKLADDNLHIRALTLNGFDSLETPLSISVTRIVSRSADLAVFQTDIAIGDFNLLKALAPLQRLRKLIINLRKVDDLTAFENIRETWFPSLETLQLQSNDLPVSTSFIRAISSSLIHFDFKGSLNDPLQPMDLEAFCSAIGDSSSNLQDVSVTITDDTARRAHPVHWGSFKPILTCAAKMLRLSVTLYSNSAFALCDDDFFQITQATPSLQSISVAWKGRDANGNGGLHDKSSVTLNTLVAFAVNCPNIFSIQLPRLHIGPLPALPKISARSERIELTFANDSPMQSPELVAAFLSMFWPRASICVGTRTRIVRPPLRGEGRVEHQWSVVEKMLDAIHGRNIMERHRGISPAKYSQDLPWRLRRAL